MKITKHQHACVVLEEQGQSLIIDPGVFTTDLRDVPSVAGVVITHVHADHFDPVKLAGIAEAHPGVPIFSTAEVAGQMAAPQITVAQGGNTVQAGPFTLTFYGEKHAVVHSSIPQNQNVGVLVNDSFYYPGDSFEQPTGANVQTLALPVSAPWLKIAESLDFLSMVKPQACFPTHNAILSAEGQGIADRIVGDMCQSLGIAYYPLKPGESIDQ